MAQITLNPAVGSNSPVDGYVADLTDTNNWTTKVGHPGTHGNPASDFNYMGWGATAVADTWDYLYRSIILFDASGIPNVKITAVTLSLYGSSKADGLSCTPDLNVYESAPADNDAVVGGDFDSLGAVALCDTPITYGNFNTGTPGISNDWVLNAAGLVLVQAAVDGDGIIKLGLRNANYDVAEENDPGNHTPPWVSGADSSLHSWASDKGAGYKPKLVIIYTPLVQAVWDFFSWA